MIFNTRVGVRVRSSCGVGIVFDTRVCVGGGVLFGCRIWHQKRSPFKDERKKEDCYLSSSSANSTIAIMTVVTPIATAIGGPCKAIDEARIADPNLNQFKELIE